ncbi:MAG: DUF4360 domain-containing protein [Geobacteraceae bacterium]
MKLMMTSIFACALLVGPPALAQESNGCPAGSYSIVVSPDGTTLSILFDQFTVESSGSGKQRKVCRISSPLNLPANYSIGIYKVDYRGFAKLATKQVAQLDVQYFLGPHDNEHGRVFKRKIKGPHESDYLFTETIGAGQMKRVGCGTAAVLNVGITLSLDGDLRAGEAMASLDTTDAAPGGALVYHFNLKKCP